MGAGETRRLAIWGGLVTGSLIYTMLTSLDGYVADVDGNFDWATPDEEVHAFINDMDRDVGTFLMGRRMYEVMAAWETMHTLPDQPTEILDFAGAWRGADKVVYSRTLKDVWTARTRLEQEFDPEAVREMKAQAQRDLSVAGPNLAAHAFRAGLVDECRLYLAPILVGGGTPSLPTGVRLKLELVEERRFKGGMVFLRYRRKT